MESNGIISQDRVKNFGEVFTPDSIVNNMIDLVDEQLNKEADDIQYISKTFLEPACGDGQFLIRILYKKLERVSKLPLEHRQLHLIKSLCAIYGIDIQPDNVVKARERMKAIATGQTVETFDLNNKVNKIYIDLGITYSEEILDVIDYILSKNILVGDALDINNPPILTDYRFNGDKVYTVESPLTDLTIEIDKTEEIHYLSLPNIKDGLDDEDDSFDF